MPLNEPASPQSVAWARLFAEKDKNNGLSRDNNVLRGDRDAFRRAFSYWVGFAKGLSRESLGRGQRKRLAADLETLGPLLDEAPFREGFDAGNALMVQGERRTARRESNAVWQVMARYGINSPAELDSVLADRSSSGE